MMVSWRLTDVDPAMNQESDELAPVSIFSYRIYFIRKYVIQKMDGGLRAGVCEMKGSHSRADAGRDRKPGRELVREKVEIVRHPVWRADGRISFLQFERACTFLFLF